MTYRVGNKRVGLRSVLGRAALAAGICMTLVLSACNTTEGAGKDIEKAGEGIQKAAERNK